MILAGLLKSGQYYKKEVTYMAKLELQGRIKKKKWFNNKNLFPYLMLLPAIIAVSFVSLYPMAKGLSMSFRDYNLIYSEYPWIGLQNYSRLMKDELFWSTFTNTILYTILNGGISTLIGLGVALLLNRASRIRGFLRGFTLIPWLIPSAVIAPLFVFMYHPDFSPINFVLKNLGLIKQPIRFLGETAFQWGAITIPFLSVLVTRLWFSFPYKAVLLLGSLQSIPVHLYEAARIDGANKWHQFRHITLPSLYPTLMVILTLTLIQNFGYFDVNFLMTQGGPKNFTNVMAVRLYLVAFKEYDFGYASAIGGVMLIVTSLIAIGYVYLLSKRDEL